MSDIKIKRALIAVYDKTGIVEFARALVDEFGIEIISTGGTAKHLKDAGVPVTMVEQVTGFPEMLDGRVKTLHPMVHAGILADRDKPEHMRQLAEHGIKPIDMVVVNLYPFEKTIARPDCTFEEAIEMIDIGGPCMLRAAAKNHKHVLVVSLAPTYEDVLLHLRKSKAPGGLDADECKEFYREYALNSFLATARYDATVSNWLEPALKFLGVLRYHTARYGENPHQSGEVCVARGAVEATLVPGPRPVGPADMEQDRIAHMSFNNYVDGDSALNLVKELSRAKLAKHAVAFIKHTNACGVAIGDDPVDTYRRAYMGDPIAAAGGVLCMNFPVTRDMADVVMNSYGSWGKAAGAAFFKLDVWIAPSFDDDAIKLITTPTEKRKWGASCRLLAVGAMDTPPDPNEMDYKKITGGMLVQTRDLLGLNEDQWKVVSKRKPTEKELADLRFAWLVCKHTKSNAITVVRDGALLGNGAGQMSRVKSCDLAIQLARENGHGDTLAGAVAAGDAFFPVEDGPQKLIAAGITAVIHPGGSNRDADSIRVCDEANVAMIMTGTRHFKH